MSSPRLRAIALGLLLPVMAACGSTSHSASRTVTPAPSGPRTLIYTTGYNGSGLYTSDGRYAGTLHGTPTPYYTAPFDSGVLEFGGPGNGVVWSVHLDGSGYTRVGEAPPGMINVVASPNGRQWAAGCVPGSSSSAVSSMCTGGVGLQTHVFPLGAQELTTPVALQWTDYGVVYVERPYGHGVLTYATTHTLGDAKLMDPTSGASLPVTPASCDFQQLTSDGTVVCIGGKPGALTVTTFPVRAGLAAASTFPLPPAVHQAGSAQLSPNHRYIAVGTSVEGDPQTELHIGVYIADLAHGGHLKPIGQPGLVPAAWVDDSHLLATRTAAEFGGPTGTYLVPVDGGPVTLVSGGTPVVGVFRQVPASGASAAPATPAPTPAPYDCIFRLRSGSDTVLVTVSGVTKAPFDCPTIGEALEFGLYADSVEPGDVAPAGSPACQATRPDPPHLVLRFYAESGSVSEICAQVAKLNPPSPSLTA